MSTRNTQRKTGSARATRENSVGWMLKMISTSLDEQMYNELKPHGLNLSQFGIMMTLLENDGLTQSEIGKQIVMPGYNTTRNIDALEEAGLVARHRHETSRRSHIVRLTARGRALGPALFAIVRDVNTRLLSGLSAQQTSSLKKLLRALPPLQARIQPK